MRKVLNVHRFSFLKFYTQKIKFRYSYSLINTSTNVFGLRKITHKDKRHIFIGLFNFNPLLLNLKVV